MRAHIEAWKFQSTRPIRGATGANAAGGSSPAISIHAPHTGRDQRHRAADTAFTDFNPRAPYGARRARCLPASSTLDFNPRAPYGARRRPPYWQLPRPGISIHAPHTGRDEISTAVSEAITEFQSTRPIRGATTPQQRHLSCWGYFNPRAPYGARRRDTVNFKR